MLKSIKVKPLVYESLDRLREKGESFSEVIERLVKAYDGLLGLGLKKKE